MSYLSTREAADYLGVSIHTIWKYVETKGLTPDLRLGKRGMGFTTKTLDAFRKSHRTLRKLTDEQYAEAGRRFHAGETLRAVAEEYGVAPEHLHRKVGARKNQETR